MISVRSIIGCAALLAIANLTPRSAALADSARPNVIVIMVDDLDVRTLGDIVDAGHMPNFKSHFRDQGIEFKNSFVTNSICCPSRATYLSGQYSHNHGVLNVMAGDGASGKNGLSYWLDRDGEANTLPVWLQEAGYKTGHIGKYLNGYGTDTAATYVPPGYDDWQGLVDPSTYSMYGYTINDNGNLLSDFREVKPENYQTDVLAKKAQEYLDESAHEGRPFFLHLAPAAPHLEQNYETGAVGAFSASIRPPKRYEHLSDGDRRNGEFPKLVLRQSFYESDLSDKPDAISNHQRISDRDYPNANKQYKDRMGALKAVDDMIGAVFAKLASLGIHDDTIVFFTSDNGWFYGEHGLMGKSWAYEEAIRVPLYVKSPRHAGLGGSDAIVLNNDLAPTIASIAQATPRLVVDGRDLSPLFDQPNGPWGRQRFLVEQFKAGFTAPSHPPTYTAIRSLSGASDTLYVRYYDSLEDFSMERYEDGMPLREYYNIASDPSQENGYALNGSGFADLARAHFDAFAEQLGQCEGAACQDLENAGLEDMIESRFKEYDAALQSAANIDAQLADARKGIQWLHSRASYLMDQYNYYDGWAKVFGWFGWWWARDEYRATAMRLRKSYEHVVYVQIPSSRQLITQLLSEQDDAQSQLAPLASDVAGLR